MSAKKVLKTENGTAKNGKPAEEVEDAEASGVVTSSESNGVAVNGAKKVAHEQEEDDDEEDEDEEDDEDVEDDDEDEDDEEDDEEGDEDDE